MSGAISLDERLRNRVLALDGDFVGVADLSPAHHLVLDQGGEMIAQFPRAVSIGVVMPFAIVDQLPRHRERAVALAYRTHSYHVLNDRLDQIASRVASDLQRDGYLAFPVRASLTVDEDKLYGHFSHKLAAHLAGLGWIGKSCLLVTPEVGPRVRWATVLTDAPLAAGKAMEGRCGTCTDCVDACPVAAFTGRNFHPSEPRELRFDAKKCDEYLDWYKRVPEMDVSVCGMCVYACPHGRKGLPVTPGA